VADRKDVVQGTLDLLVLRIIATITTAVERVLEGA
jgi:hypothetical protein